MRAALLAGNFRALCVMAVFLALFLVPLQAGATEHHLLEDFSSTQYRDALHTTAWWNTTNGELKLLPFEITLAGSRDTPGTARRVVICGDYAYVTDGSSGLQVINITNPSSPTLAGSCNTPGAAYGLAVTGDYAYVGDGSMVSGTGFQVINITNPSSPTLAGSYSSTNNGRGIATAGDYAYVAYAAEYLVGGGLGVMNISNPSSPTLAGNYSLPDDYAFAVAVAGNFAFVANGSSGLRVINISNPSSPTLAGSCDTPGTAYGVAVAGDYAYVADGSTGLRVINISNPSSPTLAGSCDTPGTAYAVAVAGDYVYVADGSSGLQVIDITSPSSPTLAGSYNTSGSAYAVAVDGDYAYVADGSSGLQAINISNPCGPILAGSYDTPGSAYGIAIDGDYAYLGDGTSGLQVINITDPSSPTLAGSYNTSGSAYAVAVDGDYAYVADEASGLQVISIANPSSPTLAGNYNTSGTAYGVAVAGDYAYVADGSSGLQVINIASPSNPTLAGTYNTPGTAYCVFVDGDYAYVADGGTGLQVINISSPSSPTLAGSYNTPGSARGIAIAGNYAYIADEGSGLQVINISSPSGPTLAGSYNTPGSAFAVAIAGNYAYVGDNLLGIQVIDISNPLNPTLAGTYNTPGSAYGVAVAGDCAYVADWGSGLQALQVYQRLVDVENNRGQSLVLNSLHENIVKAKLSTVQSESIRWEVSTNDGTNWQDLVPGGGWEPISVLGGDLIWRTTHLYSQYMVNPTCTQLDIGWLYNCAVIDSVVDVRGDEGGLVRIYFTRSGFDFTGEPTYPIASYKIYRRNATLVSGAKQTSGQMPPGTWVAVDTVTANRQEQYVCVVPTLADSVSMPIYSVYCVVAETAAPPVYFCSPPDSGYSVDNLPPAPPIGLMGDFDYPPPRLFISWTSNKEADLAGYAVYKGQSEGFVPNEGDRIGTPVDTFFVDEGFDPNVENYYKVSALDIHENESGYALLRPQDITGASTPPAVPTITWLEQNVPNPFNPITVIRFGIAEPGWVKLVVYDVAGRPVRVLVGGVRETSRYQVIWDGRDDSGRAIASGVYVYVLDAPGYREAKKMILVK